MLGHSWQQTGRVRASDALVDQLREECRGDQELAPRGVKRRGRLGRDGLVEGTALLLSFATFVRMATNMSRKDASSVLLLTGHVVAGNDDRLLTDGGDVCFRCLDHSVNATSGRVVDEWIEAVPERIPAMQDVSLGECDRDIAVRVCR
jgi:hypothetical protein